MDREVFFLKIQSIAQQIDDLIDEYDLRDEIVCLFLTGSVTE